MNTSFCRDSKLQPVLIISALLAALLGVAIASDEEVRLLNDLFEKRGYRPLIRPVQNESTPVVVQFEVTLIQLIQVNERDQVIKTNVWLNLFWTDMQISWDVNDYNGLETVRVFPDKVWRPDIVLFNNADGKYDVSYRSNVILYSSGFHNWVPPSIYTSTCTINVLYFPFDEQFCDMVFGSWTYNSRELTYQWVEVSPPDTPRDCVMVQSTYMQSAIWDLIEARGRIKFDDHEPPHASVIYTIRIRRKTLFYTINLLIPCILISLLTVCTFYLPVVEGEKVTMAISIVLALVVFLLLVSKWLPATSISSPLISRYLLFTFWVNIVAMTMTIVIINLSYRTPKTHRMPSWIKTVFMGLLPRLLHIRRPDHIIQEELAEKVRAEMRRQEMMNALSLSQELVSLQERESKQLGSSNSNNRRSANTSVRQRHAQPSSSKKEKTYWPATSNDVDAPRSSYAQINGILSPQTSGDEELDRTVEIHGKYPKNNAFQPSRYDTMSGEIMSEEMGSYGDVRERESVKVIFAKARSKRAILRKQLKDAVDAVHYMETHQEEENQYNTILDEWRFVATVIDRISLLLFLVVTFLGTIYFFLQAPYIFENVDQQEVINKLLQLNTTTYCSESTMIGQLR